MSIKSCLCRKHGYSIPSTAKGNKDYRYADVPKPVYEDLKASDSAGKFFLAYIKPVFKVVE